MSGHNIKAQMQAKAYAEAHIADAETSHSLSPSFNDAEVETALDALGTKINAILTVLETWGVVEDS